MPPRTPHRIGDLVAGVYRLRAPLGEGGMGIVYEAQHVTGEMVAIKVLHPDRVASDDAARRFHDEALAAGRITHPNVVAILDHSAPDDESPFVVMEHVRGISLGTILRRSGALPLRRCSDLARQILAGLEAAHDAGVVHADIKSDNILVVTHRDGTDTIKIIDFGLATIGVVTEQDHVLTQGTPDYMAPEVIRGEGPRASSDLYAVGVILYEMITGLTPFGGGPPTDVLERHLRDLAVPPSLRRPDRFIPASLERVVLLALAKDPSARHPSAAAFAAALASATPLTEPAPVRRYVGHAEADVYSMERPTCDLPPVKRLAEGTGKVPRKRTIEDLREGLAAAFERRAIDEVIVTSLELARLMVDDHHLAGAVHELEVTVDTLTNGEGVMAMGAPEPMWRLLLTLAALYHGIGDSARALQAAAAAHHHATVHRSETGLERADSLLQRLRPAIR